MLYRHFPKFANEEFPILGLDCSRFADGDGAANLVRAGIESGAALFDCLGGAEDDADVELAESLLGKALGAAFGAADGRDCAVLTGSIGAGGLSASLEARLARLGRPAIDLFALSLPDEAAITRARESGDGSALAQATRDGRVRIAGFRAPADPALLAAIAQAPGFPDWGFCVLPLNYRDLGAAADECLREAARLGLGVIASDPFAGGVLENPPPTVRALFRDAPKPRNTTEWALRALWERQELTAAVAPYRRPEDLVRDAIFAEAGRPNSLPAKELAVLSDAARALVRANP